MSMVLLLPLRVPAQVSTDRGDEARARLERAIAEADRLDPGWRFKDLEGRRVRPASGRDSAVVLAAT